MAIIAIIWQAADLFGSDTSSNNDILHLLRMSSIQAGLSVMFALATGAITATCLNRLNIRFKPTILAFLSAGLVLPTLVVAFGLIAIWGRAGVLSDIGVSMGMGRVPFSIFGLPGILAAHTLLNGSFAARIFYDRLQAIPSPSLKLAQSLDLSEWQRFITLDFPVFKSASAGLAATIFLMCFTSFSVVLLLGGGPNNSTFEMAIFEAVRLDFDLHRAALLAAAQLLFCLLIIIPTAALKNNSLLIGTPDKKVWQAKGWAKPIYIFLLTILLFAYATPLLAIVIKGLDPNLFNFIATPKFLKALANSCIIATSSAVVTLLLAFLLGLARADIIYANGNKLRSTTLRMLANAPVFAYLAVPAVVLGLGFFLGARWLILDTGSIGIYVVILANALLALPFANATLGPPMEKIANKSMRLAKSLNISGWDRLRYLELPLLRKESAYVFTLGFCFSFGDLGVIALFGTEDLTTLPWLMYRALGAYRSNDAAMIASMLLILSVFFFFLFPKLLAGFSHAKSK